MALATFSRSSSGFSLMEIIVAIGLLSVVMGFFGSSVFQALSIQRTWRDDVVARRELRSGVSWFTADALNAETVNLADCGDAPCVTLAWTDLAANCRHTAVYKMASTTLVRLLDNTTTTAVVDDVVSGGTSFAVSSRVITFGLEVTAAQGDTASSTVNTYMRKQTTPPAGAC